MRRSRLVPLALAVTGPALVGLGSVGLAGVGAAGAAVPGRLTGLNGACVDVPAAGTANGTRVQVWTCSGTVPQQQWRIEADGTIRSLGKCLDVAGGRRANGTRIQLWDCHGNSHQQWRYDPSTKELVNPGTGKCLDVTGEDSTNGTKLQLWVCNGQSNQEWTLPTGASPTPTPTVTQTPTMTPRPTATPTPAPPSGLPDLASAAKKEVAMKLVSSAENSSLDWRAQYAYIEDIGDGRGYTAGIIGFCSGTGDMLEVVRAYTASTPGNVLAKYIPALQRVDGSDSHSGLDPSFTADWRVAAKDPAFQRAQDKIRDETYFNPAVRQAKSDGLRALGQFAYYDAIVMHGPGNSSVSFGGIRAAALRVARTPAQGGSEVAYLNAFLDARTAAMRTEEAHSDTSRVDTAQRVFLRNGNLDLNTPLTWAVYGDRFTIS